MSAKCPLICSAVELWYKMMLEIRNQSDLTENHIKRKATGSQRLSSNWLWLFMAAYKPSFPDAKYFFNAYLCSCKCLIYNVLQSFTEGHKFVRGDKLGTAFLQRN